MRGLYIHIPFCREKCIYCDFYSQVYEFEKAVEFVEVLKFQIKNLKNKIFSTIYIGGGTPSVLEISLLEELLKELYTLIKKAREVTLEANPESLTPEKVELVKDFVNRVSIGVQSFNDVKLKRLTRIHNSEIALKCVLETSKKIKNVNIDLIFGVWGEGIEDLKRDLEIGASLPVTHISVYNLTYEEGTPLWRLRKEGKIIPLDNEIEAQMYKVCLEYLEEKGFRQYEISNFSKKGYECLHNLNYWNMGEFLGLGLGASSFLKNVYYKNPFSLKKYVDRVKRRKEVFSKDVELDFKKRIKYKTILGLRKIEGIELTKGEFDVLKERLILLQKKRYISLKSSKSTYKIFLTKKGVFFYDELARNILLC